MKPGFEIYSIYKNADVCLPLPDILIETLWEDIGTLESSPGDPNVQYSLDQRVQGVAPLGTAQIAEVSVGG